MRKRYAESELLLREAIEFARTIDQAILWGTLAMLYADTKRLAESLTAAREALRLTEQ